METVIKDIPSACQGVHESMTRGYQILEKVKYLLELETNPKVIRELISFMEIKP
jgi:hypothetical protein